jgi:hypothetical protein
MMLRKWAFVVVVMSGAVGTSYAETYPGGPRYDGRIVVRQLLGAACATLPDQPGDKHRAIFRSKVSEDGLAEAMSVDVENGLLFVSAATDETFAGRNQVGSGTLIVDAYRTALPDPVFNLKFEPAVVDPATTDSFKFKGSWKNYKEVGCTAIVAASFLKRPD